MSNDFTINAPLVSLEFCLNSVFYHWNTKSLIDPTSKGCEDILNGKLSIPLDNKKEWLFGDGLGFRYSKIFRFWKLIGRGYIPEASAQVFLIDAAKKGLENNKNEFLMELARYLGRDYNDFESYSQGCSVVMGKQWRDEVIQPMLDEILKSYRIKEEAWDKHTYQP